MIRVTLAQATHFILAKNHLAEPTADLVRLVGALGGVPADPPATPFFALFARLKNFTPSDLITAHQKRLLARTMLMRGHRYFVPIEAFSTFQAATARQRRQNLNSEFRLWDIKNSEIEQLGQAILAVVDDQPRAAEVISNQLSPDVIRDLTQTSRGGRVSQTTNVALALRWLTANGQLYALPDPALATDWRRDEVLYTRSNVWSPETDLIDAPDEAPAQAAVVRAYLTAFGPASEADISFWTGFGKSETARAISALSAETTLTLVEGIPGITLLLKSQADALQAVAAPAEPVINILPADDPFLAAHRASRARYFADQKLQRQIFNSAGAAKPTIVIDGQVVGVWDVDPQTNQISWRLLAKVNRGLESLIEDKVEHLERFIMTG